MKKKTEKEPRFQIKYLLNSAVLIQYGTEKLLIDGILSNHQMFDVYDEPTQNAIWERKIPWIIQKRSVRTEIMLHSSSILMKT